MPNDVTCDRVPGVTARFSSEAAAATDKELARRVRRRMMLGGGLRGCGGCSLSRVRVRFIHIWSPPLWCGEKGALPSVSDSCDPTSRPSI